MKANFASRLPELLRPVFSGAGLLPDQTFVPAVAGAAASPAAGARRGDIMASGRVLKSEAVAVAADAGAVPESYVRGGPRAMTLATHDGKLEATFTDGRLVVEGGVLRSLQLGVKRLIDFCGAAVALLLLSPLLLSVAAIIKLTSKGPVFFTQNRVGLDNQLFKVYKFRSMYTDRGDRSGVRQTEENDPRITPIGRFIRKTSIDELPQLINVLKGDMSIVGPRPHVPGMLAGGMVYEDLVPYYAERHMMRPGITGLAQANGFRGPTTDAVRARARVDYDLVYIKNFSLWLDVKIIFKTAYREFFTGSGF